MALAVVSAQDGCENTLIVTITRNLRTVGKSTMLKTELGSVARIGIANRLRKAKACLKTIHAFLYYNFTANNKKTDMLCRNRQRRRKSYVSTANCCRGLSVMSVWSLLVLWAEGCVLLLWAGAFHPLALFLLSQLASVITSGARGQCDSVHIP